MSPHTGTEPGYKVCDSAGAGSALGNATVKGGGTITKRSGGDNG